MTKLSIEIEKCLESGIPTNELIKLAAQASLACDSEDLENMKLLMKEEYLAPIVIACLPGWREAGVNLLIEYAFDDDLKLKTRTGAMECAICISQGNVPTSEDIQYLPSTWNKCKKYFIDEDLSRFCLFSLRERLLNAFDDDYKNHLSCFCSELSRCNTLRNQKVFDHKLTIFYR